MDAPAIAAEVDEVDEVDESAAAPRSARRRGRLLVSVLGPLAVLGVFAYVLAHNGAEISQAAARVTAFTLIAVTLLALITLIARTEAVLACLAAMETPWDRLDIHAANSLTFMVNTINHYVSSIVRATLVKRLDPARAPTITQMILVDASTTLIEGLLVAVLIVVSAGALKLAWWMPVLAVLAALAGVMGALAIRRRFERFRAFRGLEVLAHSRQRLRVAALMVLVFACQIARTLIVLRATGLHPSLVQATATFITAGVLSSLIAGPAAGTAAAPLIIFGHRSLAAAAAAGLILSITALLAAVVYAALGAPFYLWQLRRASR
jgi:hypothetical protein